METSPAFSKPRRTFMHVSKQTNNQASKQESKKRNHKLRCMKPLRRRVAEVAGCHGGPPGRPLVLPGDELQEAAGGWPPVTGTCRQWVPAPHSYVIRMPPDIEYGLIGGTGQQNPSLFPSCFLGLPLQSFHQACANGPWWASTGSCTCVAARPR